MPVTKSHRTKPPRITTKTLDGIKVYNVPVRTDLLEKITARLKLLGIRWDYTLNHLDELCQKHGMIDDMYSLSKGFTKKTEITYLTLYP